MHEYEIQPSDMFENWKDEKFSIRDVFDLGKAFSQIFLTAPIRLTDLHAEELQKFDIHHKLLGIAYKDDKALDEVCAQFLKAIKKRELMSAQGKINLQVSKQCINNSLIKSCLGSLILARLANKSTYFSSTFIMLIVYYFQITDDIYDKSLLSQITKRSALSTARTLQWHGQEITIRKVAKIERCEPSTIQRIYPGNSLAIAATEANRKHGQELGDMPLRRCGIRTFKALKEDLDHLRRLAPERVVMCLSINNTYSLEEVANNMRISVKLLQKLFPGKSLNEATEKYLNRRNNKIEPLKSVQKISQIKAK